MDSLANKVSKLTRDIANGEKHIRDVEKREQDLLARKTELENNNKELSLENKAHIDFIESFFNEKNLSTQLTEIRRENAELKEEISKKDQLIKTLQEESPAESVKIADKNKEIKNLKTRTGTLEDHINELQGKL